MNSVAEHYELLSPIYAWMSGSAEAALEAGRAEIDALPGVARGRAGGRPRGGLRHARIPMARAGARVIAIDTSAELLAELERLAGDLPVTTVQDDLLSFRSHLTEKAAAVLCMGDTLTHLPEHTTSISWSRKSTRRWFPAATSCSLFATTASRCSKIALHSRAQRRTTDPHLFSRVRGRHRGGARHPARTRR